MLIKFNYIHIDEYKLSKTRLLEVVERSIPSHIYILVSIIILLKFTYTKLKFAYFFFIANFTNYRRINKILNVVRR